MAQKKSKKSPAEKLGLERIKLNVKNCRDRAQDLRRRIEREEFRGETLQLARRWASWYQAKANSLRSQPKKAARKAA